MVKAQAGEGPTGGAALTSIETGAEPSPGVGLNAIGIEKQHCPLSALTSAAMWEEMVGFVKSYL